ncbi:hypothetical protein E2C01_000469 [Portunus trituberculatus]|uniref:Uncharacterized protein n=1 Tax=Portunus trituberculatus TaxID=210409 RepID=A0A5B7CE61_PORTR|nr:hypothetical protein [Portunus trituberculatus]
MHHVRVWVSTRGPGGSLIHLTQDLFINFGVLSRAMEDMQHTLPKNQCVHAVDTAQDSTCI